MDMQKIGSFLGSLRKEAHLTQEELGDKLGVTNKTISRWETGTYLPPVEMLQLLSKFYNVTINEILSGERLGDADYKVNAEKNIVKALDTSMFTAKEKAAYFKKKWLKDHLFEIILEIILLLTASVLCVIYKQEYCFIVFVIALIWSTYYRNKRDEYIEYHLFDDVNTCADEDKKQ